MHEEGAEMERNRKRKGNIWILHLSPRRLGFHVSEIRRILDSRVRDGAFLISKEVPAA
jgi:hypothetical protein